MGKLDQVVIEVFLDESESIGDDTLFAACPSWDSLKYVELVMGIEAGFDVDLSADEIRRLTCKRAVRDVLAARGLNG